MDEFKRMMMMEGVEPINSRYHDVPAKKPVAANTNEIPARDSKSKPVRYAWMTDGRARQTLDVAMTRAVRERKEGKKSWITGIAQDGKSGDLTTMIAAPPLLAYADRMNLKLIVIGGEGWTCVFHPAMGAATLDDDPGI